MPILKQLVSTSSQSKRRSRVDLTAEMISAPLGDFRHTMHVGRGGDAFGDTSFLSTRSGEPPKEPEAPQSSPKQSLLSRTFRSSRRSQSVNRQDKSSQNSVKSAISLPYLNQDPPALHLPKSVSSSPLKKLPELNGAASQSELEERSFGEITDLPPSQPFSGGLRHAESVMSFHIDLGPSMLGDILSVMNKKAWEEDDLGFEEGKSSSAEESDRRPTGSPQPRSHQHLDSCSVSSSGSTLTDDKPPAQAYGAPRVLDDRDFSYMDEDEDEIRV